MRKFVEAVKVKKGMTVFRKLIFDIEVFDDGRLDAYEFEEKLQKAREKDKRLLCGSQTKLDFYIDDKEVKFNGLRGEGYYKVEV